MKIDFLGLEAFISIAEAGNFGRAGAHLNLSQTAVSHRLRKLESSLGAQLFSRSTRQITLTSTGRELLPWAQALFFDADRQLNEIRQHSESSPSRLAFGCLPTVASKLLPALLARFQRSRPNVSVCVYDTSATDIGELVSSGGAEFAVTILAGNQWGLAAEPLISEDYLLVCPRGHPYTKKKSVAWGELHGQNLIRVSQQSANRIIIDEALGTRSERLNWNPEVHHTTLALG
jgi:DNA-binding transcriptional LysR family regulator